MADAPCVGLLGRERGVSDGIDVTDPPLRDRRNLRLLPQWICVRRGFGCGYENCRSELAREAVCQTASMSQTRRFATVVTSDCSYRGFACDADLDADTKIVGVSLLASAVGQTASMSQTRRFATVVTSDCSHSGFACYADFGCGCEWWERACSRRGQYIRHIFSG